MIGSYHSAQFVRTSCSAVTMPLVVIHVNTTSLASLASAAAARQFDAAISGAAQSRGERMRAAAESARARHPGKPFRIASVAFCGANRTAASNTRAASLNSTPRRPGPSVSKALIVGGRSSPAATARAVTSRLTPHTMASRCVALCSSAPLVPYKCSGIPGTSKKAATRPAEPATSRRSMWRRLHSTSDAAPDRMPAFADVSKRPRPKVWIRLPTSSPRRRSDAGKNVRM
mmetsp:Transcript_27461/g.85166  ORF Transcript_27461/g.85166 Transcript_27461/m.85166 type:complete len:230 (-) Transcript_27461:271-960(-)